MSTIPWRWRAARRVRWWMNTHGRHQFTDRSHGHQRLAIILAGYYQDLWPATLERFAAHAPSDLDVCLIGAGPRAAAVTAAAERFGWSCLRTADAQPSLAMNLAIQAHPHAELIHKLDEDIVVPARYVERMEDALSHSAAGPWPIEVLAPALNVNPFSYRIVLAALNATAAYEQRFGPARAGLFDCPAYHSAEAAAFIWERCLPFDHADRACAAAAEQHFGTASHAALIPVPMRFCIGAILLRRTWWHSIGGFRRKLFGAALGVDEEHLCFATANNGKTLAVHSGLLAGHLGFAPQRAGLRGQVPEWIAACRG